MFNIKKKGLTFLFNFLVEGAGIKFSKQILKSLYFPCLEFCSKLKSFIDIILKLDKV